MGTRLTVILVVKPMNRSLSGILFALTVVVDEKDWVVSNFSFDSRPLGDYSKDNMADVEVRVRHTCRECGKSYNKKSRLEEHIRSHTGEVSK